jgi:hypothetical protein
MKMRFRKHAAVAFLFAAAIVVAMLASTTGIAGGDANTGVHAVPGVRNANPTPDASVKVTVSRMDGFILVEGTVVFSDSSWVCIDQTDGTTAWIPNSSIVLIEGTRTPVR